MPDDDGITLIPIGPGLGTSTEVAKQFSSGTARFLRRFASNPAALVISVVSGFVVSVLFGFFEFLIGAVLFPFDLLVGGLAWVQRQLVVAFAFVGFDLLGALRGLQQSLVAVVESAGPAGPLVAMAAAGVTLFVLYRVTVAGLALVPGGSSIMALLGR
ncbi:hypothetical protein [Haloglomus litoreum]|uniref:hypothetical protein n=1 Tax=Haloglomus litoreum TaxID=3034026 RepID=UPI0023E8E272|nr:hypothetical protein [Haloglomus sp. DT116]